MMLVFTLDLDSLPAIKSFNCLQPTTILFFTKFVSKLLPCPSSDFFMCVNVRHWHCLQDVFICFRVQFWGHFLSLSTFCTFTTSQRSWQFCLCCQHFEAARTFCSLGIFREASFKNSSIKVNYRGASWKLTHACNCHSTLPVDFVTPELELLPYIISFFYFILPKCSLWQKKKKAWTAPPS